MDKSMFLWKAKKSMKFQYVKIFFALTVVATLAACGGGGGEQEDIPGPVACGNNPVITPDIRFLGVIPTGKIGEWRFDTEKGVVEYNVDGQSGSFNLQLDEASCAYTSTATGNLKTSFVKHDDSVLAISAAGNVPAMLVSEPKNIQISDVAGTYNALITYDEAGWGTTFQTIKINPDGSYRFCWRSSYSDACPETGYLQSNADGGFDMYEGNRKMGRLLPHVTANAKSFIAVSETNYLTEFWLATLNTEVSDNTADGFYVSNYIDVKNEQYGSQTDRIAGQKIESDDSSTSRALKANQPVQGAYASTVGNVEEGDILVSSPSGLLAQITSRGSEKATLTFGVKSNKP